jgi:Cu-Zn family superoxide dismutase
MHRLVSATVVAATAAAASALAPAGPANGATPAPRAADVAGYTAAHAGVVTGSGITGRSQLTARASGGAIVTFEAAGLEPGHEYGAHVHTGRCTDYLGHFRYDPAGSGVRSNEVWLDLVANAAGRATARVAVATLPGQALSIVIHQESNPDHPANTTGATQPGPRLACGDYATNGS